DGWEWDRLAALGARPARADSDGDGLSDGDEVALGTRPDLADTDGDGLPDGQEVRRLDAAGAWVGGWSVTLPGGATIWVRSDPLQADADQDGLNDAEEKRNGLSPHAPNQATPTLTLDVAPLAGIPGAKTGLFLLPGDAVTATIHLANWAAAAVTTTLSLALPAFLSDVRVGDLTGSRTIPAQGSGGAYTWSFAAPNQLALYEVVSATVTARIAVGAGSGSGALAVSLPHGGLALGESVPVVLDSDNPAVAIIAPTDGALLTGASYVVGGGASDPTTWVEGVWLSAVAEGSAPSYEPVSGLAPWAATWSPPGDGRYTLQARAADALGHESVSAAVRVTVDNTPPSATLAVGSYVTGGTTTIPLRGAADDNLSGVERVQLSINGQPWRSVALSGAGTTHADWSYDWVVSGEAQGEHLVELRAADRAGNASAIVSQRIVVDRVPPASYLTGGAAPDAPPAVPVGQPLILAGVADEGGHLPLPARPAELRVGMDVYDDATVWLGLSSASETSASGVSAAATAAAWLGDLNGDRLADLAVGLPAARGGRGEVTVVYGRSGDWPAPPNPEPLAESRARLVGAAGAGLGALLAAAGDANGDGLADLLVGEADSDRAYLVRGLPGALGELALDEAPSGYRTLLRAPAAITALAGAGDVDGDGLDDLLVAAGGAAYLLLAPGAAWPATVDVAADAAASWSGVTGALGVGDINGDQLADWAVTAPGEVRLHLGNGAALSATPVATWTSADAAPRVAAVGDANADGFADLLYTDGALRILVLGSADTWSWSTRTLAGYDGLVAAPGDVDGDGWSDLLLGRASGVVELIRPTPGIVFRTAATISGVAGAAQAPYAAGADLNADGSSDLFLIPTAAAAEAGGFAPLAAARADHIAPAALPQAAAGTATRSANLDRDGVSLGALTGIARYVDDDGGCAGNAPCAASIQAAVDAASAGDTILVYPGVYGPVAIRGVDHLTIRGVDPDAVFIDAGGIADDA
ncbi:MAG: hypothetical protein GXY76_10955, partial [Chloroflexi bacterium]|nr:hypothetical protein [Chloroflexota bacterium]